MWSRLWFSITRSAIRQYLEVCLRLCVISGDLVYQRTNLSLILFCYSHACVFACSLLKKYKILCGHSTINLLICYRSKYLLKVVGDFYSSKHKWEFKASWLYCTSLYINQSLIFINYPDTTKMPLELKALEASNVACSTRVPSHFIKFWA